jgi:hypothetical protein
MVKMLCKHYIEMADSFSKTDKRTLAFVRDTLLPVFDKEAEELAQYIADYPEHKDKIQPLLNEALGYAQTVRDRLAESKIDLAMSQCRCKMAPLPEPLPLGSD